VSSFRSLFRGSQVAVEVDVEPLIEPRATIDGWTLDGTRLVEAVPRGEQRELCTLLHGIAVRADTPYTYVRAAEILEHSGERAQAYAVCEAWLSRSSARNVAYAHDTRAITRTRERLRSRLAAEAARGTAAS
jgi:hypothetical protein